MNLWDLKRMLVESGAPESTYFLVGIDVRSGSNGGDNGELVVARTDSEHGWLLTSTERGRTTYEARFDSEDAACRAAWEQLEPFPHPVHERSPAEKARALDRAAELRRDYERLTAEFRARRTGQSGPD